MVTSTRFNSSGRSRGRSQPPPGAPALAPVVAPAPIVVPAPVAPATCFIEDPHQGNVNPGADQGLKLHLNDVLSMPCQHATKKRKNPPDGKCAFNRVVLPYP